MFTCKCIEFIAVANKLAGGYGDLVLNFSPEYSSAIIRRKYVTCIGPTKRPSFNPNLSLVLGNDGEVMYTFEANLAIVETGTICDEHSVTKWLESMKEGSKYVLCPGLPFSKEYPPPAKRLKKCSAPLKDQRHDECLLWHVPQNRKVKASSHMYDMCYNCKHLYSYLEERAKFLVPDEVKEGRTKVSSKYPISSLSPNSQAVRRKNLMKLNNSLKEKVSKLSKRLSLCVPNDQHEELTKIISEIQGKHVDEVNKILTEADDDGKGNILRALWEQDIKEHLEFHSDQKKNSGFYFIATL